MEEIIIGNALLFARKEHIIIQHQIIHTEYVKTVQKDIIIQIPENLIVKNVQLEHINHMKECQIVTNVQQEHTVQQQVRHLHRLARNVVKEHIHLQELQVAPNVLQGHTIQTQDPHHYLLV